MAALDLRPRSLAVRAAPAPCVLAQLALRAHDPVRTLGDRADERDPLLRPPTRRVRAGGGRAPVGRRRQRVPRLPLWHLRDEHRPLPPAGGGGRARAGRAADARLEPFLYRAGDAPRRPSVG